MTPRNHKPSQDYITRIHDDHTAKRKYVKLMNVDSTLIGELWIDTRHIVCTESTFVEVSELIAQKLTGGKNRQMSFLEERDLPPMPRSQK